MSTVDIYTDTKSVQAANVVLEALVAKQPKHGVAFIKIALAEQAACSQGAAPSSVYRLLELSVLAVEGAKAYLAENKAEWTALVLHSRDVFHV